jgi:hypothetical protein
MPVNRNLLLYGISIYHCPQYTATNRVEKTVASYQGLTVYEIGPVMFNVSLRDQIHVGTVEEWLEVPHMLSLTNNVVESVVYNSVINLELRW